jgi:hypothetical protein
MLNNQQQRLEGLKPSKRYTPLKINLLARIVFCRFFKFNYLNPSLIPTIPSFLIQIIRKIAHISRTKWLER